MLKRDIKPAAGVSTMIQAESADALVAAPSKLMAVASEGRVDLTWRDNSNNEDGFIVKRRLASEVNFTDIATRGANVTTYSDSQVLANTKYVYRVLAFRRAGGRAASNDATVTTLAKTTIYLTFDDGPYPATAEVLDQLKSKATATFFLCSKHMERNTSMQLKLIQRMIAEGHTIGNHGYDHDPDSRSEYERTTTAAVKKDFTDNTKLLADMFLKNGDRFPGFEVARLPGDGRFMAAFVEMITKDLRLPHAGWNMEFAPNGVFPKHVDRTNWQGIAGVAASKPDFPRNNDVLLLHDAHWQGRGKKLGQLVDKLLERFKVASFVPVPRGLPGTVTYP